MIDFSEVFWTAFVSSFGTATGIGAAIVPWIIAGLILWGCGCLISWFVYAILGRLEDKRVERAYEKGRAMAAAKAYEEGRTMTEGEVKDILQHEERAP